MKWFALIAFVAALTACANTTASHDAASSTQASSPSAQLHGDPSLAAAPPGGQGAPNPFLTDGDAVKMAIAAVKKHINGPLRTLEINVLYSTQQITLEVQDPKNHENVDAYVVDPTFQVQGPSPVQLTGATVTPAVIDANVFDPLTVDFSKLRAFAQAVVVRSKQPDMRVQVWTLRRKSNLGPPLWSISAQSARRSVNASADTHGAITYFSE